MTRGFQSLEHTADRAIEAWGDTLPELFTAAAEGMFAESVSCEAVQAEREWVIVVEAESREGLLHHWLAELLWVAERDECVVCRVAADEVSEQPCRATGRAWGGSPPADLPHTGAPVKAVTYHELKVWPEQDPAGAAGWRARVVFDV